MQSRDEAPPRGLAWLCDVVSSPRGSARVIALACLLCVPTLFMGMAADDHELKRQVIRDPLGAYVFMPRGVNERHALIVAARDKSELPWWIDEDCHQAFMRPLSSLSLAADFRLWPRAFWWMHLENVLLVALGAALAHAFYRRLLQDETSAGLAAFFYATSPGLALSAGWLSARNTLLAFALGLLALVLDQRARERSGCAAILQRAYAVSAFAAALLSAELGLSALGFLVAAQLTRDAGSWPRRFARVAPYLLVVVAWQLFYRRAGFGVISSAYYRDPVSTPSGFALSLLAAIPTYLASTLSLPFASLSIFSERAMLFTALASLVVLFVLRGAFTPLLQASPSARFLALGALLSTVPLGASLAQDRLALFVSLGSAGLVGMLVAARRTDPDLASDAHIVRMFRLHAWFRPALFLPSLFVPYGMAVEGGANLLDRTLPKRDDQPIVLLNAPSALPAHYFRRTREAQGLTPPPLVLLTAGGAPVRVRSAGARALELEVDRGFLHSLVEQVNRDLRRRPFRVGDALVLQHVTIRVLEVVAGDARRVRFDLHGKSMPLLYAWHGRELRTFTPPPVGETVELPPLSLL